MSTMLNVGETDEWTVERLDAFLSTPSEDDIDWRRFEIIDGTLLVSPPPLPVHQLAVAELIHALAPCLPAGHRVIGAARIAVGRSYRVTDVTVVTEAAIRSRESTIAFTDVLVAVEIDSRSSITTDRITKPAEYAAAGIAHYWRVETDPLSLVTYSLRDGVYVETSRWAEGETATITEPFAVTIDVARLLPD